MFRIWSLKVMSTWAAYFYFSILSWIECVIISFIIWTIFSLVWFVSVFKCSISFSFFMISWEDCEDCWYKTEPLLFLDSTLAVLISRVTEAWEKEPSLRSFDKLKVLLYLFGFLKSAKLRLHYPIVVSCPFKTTQAKIVEFLASPSLIVVFISIFSLNEACPEGSSLALSVLRSFWPLLNWIKESWPINF